jgi:ParB family transcriptional regulator, chromosome partitioning protein
MVKLKGLGRGLDALLSGKEAISANDIPNSLALDAMQPGKYQPRTHMDPAALESLAESIRGQGLLQPILVRPIGAERYEIIAGERRWRAARLAGLEQVPVLVRAIPDEATLAVALIENIQRENLNAIEEAQGLQRLIDEFGLTHEQAAKAVGRSRAAVSNLLRLLDLEPSVRALLSESALDMGHARALLGLPTEEQPAAALEVIDRVLNVRATEQMVQRRLTEIQSEASHQPEKQNQTAFKSTHKMSADIRHLEQELSDHLGAQVNIKTKTKGGGDLILHFHDLDQLDGLISVLRR